MIENYGGLSYKGSENNGNTIYVEIKPDSLLVRRLQDNDAEQVFNQKNNGTLDREFRVRELEMGPNKGQQVAEQIFDEISNVQLIKAESEEKFNQRRMVLVFNNMQDDSPNIQVQCTLINDYNSVNGYASSFIDRIPNITIGTPMTIKTWMMTDKKTGKVRRGITILQNNEKVQSAYYDYLNNVSNSCTTLTIQTIFPPPMTSYILTALRRLFQFKTIRFVLDFDLIISNLLLIR